MHDELTIEMELFQHTEVKPHFINPCCFGEDFAGWLRDKLSPLASAGFTFSEPIQEDYGWGFWSHRDKDAFWIVLGFVGDSPTEEPAQWVISLNYDPGLNLFKRLFQKPDATAFHELRDRVWQLVQSTQGIKILEPEPA